MGTLPLIRYSRDEDVAYTTANVHHPEPTGTAIFEIDLPTETDMTGSRACWDS